MQPKKKCKKKQKNVKTNEPHNDNKTHQITLYVLATKINLLFFETLESGVWKIFFRLVPHVSGSSLFFTLFSHFFHTFFALFLILFLLFSDDFANFRFFYQNSKISSPKVRLWLEALWPAMVAWPWLGLRPRYLTLGFWFWQEAPGWWPGGCFMLFSFLGSFIGSYVLCQFPFLFPFSSHFFLHFLDLCFFCIAFLLHCFYNLFFWQVAFFLDGFCKFIILLFSNDSLLPTHIILGK